MERFQSSRTFYFCVLLLSAYLGIAASQKHECVVSRRGCSGNYTEVYRDERTQGTLYECCIPGSKQAATKEQQADSCSASDCVSTSSSGGDLCAYSIGTRTVNSTGVSYIFVEAVRDECKLDDGSTSSGVEALCCPQNSTDLMLTTLIGSEPHEFPSFARFESSKDSGVSICGATVYNERYVITASHCVVDKEKYGPADANKMSIFLDIMISGKNTDNKYGIEEVIVHPNASLLSKDKTPLNNDIALLKLDRDIQFSDRILALPLAPKGFQPNEYGDTAIIIGFGDTDTLTTSKKLQKADAYIRDTVKNTEKGSRYPQHKGDRDQLLFLGGFQDGIPSPSGSGGDSGGSAVCRDKDGNAVLCGLTSFGPDNKVNCEREKNEQECFPTSYVKVDHFRDWIEETAGNQEHARVMTQSLYGLDVPYDKHPSQVEIKKGGKKNDGKSCGGTLIAADVILTAAHCVANDKGEMEKGLMVSHKLGNGEAETQGVKNIEVLDGFKRILDKNGRRRRIAVFAAKPTWDDPYYQNDLALVKLKKALTIPANKLPKIPQAEAQPGLATEVAWVTDSRRKGNMTQRQFNLMTHNECQTRMDRLTHMGLNIKVDENVVCGVEKFSGGSKCDRTTGGGLFCAGGTTLCGVQVFRLCEFAVPNVFMDVGMNAQWISNFTTA